MTLSLLFARLFKKSKMPTEKDDENIFKNDNDNNHNNIVTADCWRRLAPGRGSPARSMSALCFTHSRAQKKKVIDDGDGDDDGDAIHPTTSLTQPWKWLWFFFCPGRGWCANLFEKMIHVLFFIFFFFPVFFAERSNHSRAHTHASSVTNSQFHLVVTKESRETSAMLRGKLYA